MVVADTNAPHKQAPAWVRKLCAEWIDEISVLQGKVESLRSEVDSLKNEIEHLKSQNQVGVVATELSNSSEPTLSGSATSALDALEGNESMNDSRNENAGAPDEVTAEATAGTDTSTTPVVEETDSATGSQTPEPALTNEPPVTQASDSIGSQDEVVSAPAEVTPATDSPSALKLLIDKAIADETAQYDDDLRRAEGHKKVIDYWNDACQKLASNLPDASAKVINSIDSAIAAHANLDDSFRAVLESRISSLDAVKRMLAQLNARLEDIVVEAPKADLVLPRAEADWIEKLASLTDEDEAARQIRDLQDQNGGYRWKELTTLREFAESRRRAFLSLVEKRLLPILDALDTGSDIARTEISRVVAGANAGNIETKAILESSFKAAPAPVQEWFGVYKESRETILTLLQNVSISRMSDAQEIGTPIDFDRHQPDEAIESETLKDETIAELRQHGYEMPDSDGTTRVVRVAHVVMAYHRPVSTAESDTVSKTAAKSPEGDSHAV